MSLEDFDREPLTKEGWMKGIITYILILVVAGLIAFATSGESTEEGDEPSCGMYSAC